MYFEFAKRDSVKETDAYYCISYYMTRYVHRTIGEFFSPYIKSTGHTSVSPSLVKKMLIPLSYNMVFRIILDISDDVESTVLSRTKSCYFPPPLYLSWKFWCCTVFCTTGNCEILEIFIIWRKSLYHSLKSHMTKDVFGLALPASNTILKDLSNDWIVYLVSFWARGDE